MVLDSNGVAIELFIEIERLRGRPYEDTASCPSLLCYVGASFPSFECGHLTLGWNWPSDGDTCAVLALPLDR